MADYTRLRSGLIRRGDAFIPADPANADYRAFLAWEAAGNVADVEAEPAAAPVSVVPAWAGKAALDEAGLLSQVQTLTAGAGLAWRWRFSDATEWHRDAVLQLAPQLSLTEAQVDALMSRAAALAAS